MSMELTGLCLHHSFESATALCRRCGLEFCETCVVFPFGAKKPLCKDCALLIGGVKTHATRPEMAGRIVRRRAKAFAKTVKAAGAPMPEPDVPDIVDPTTGLEPATPARATPEFAYAPASERDDPGGRSTSAHGQQPAEGVAPVVDWNNPFG